MIPHLHRHCRPALKTTVRRFPNRQNRKWFPILLPGLALILACASCSESPSPKPPPVPVTDTRPVGEGLKVLAYALLGASCVIVLGRLIRS